MPIVPRKPRKPASKTPPVTNEALSKGQVGPTSDSNRTQSEPAPSVQPDASVQSAAARTNKRSGPNWNEDGSYNVGRGKPSVKHQWQPGQSGNPKGSRKKERPDADAIIIQIMEESKWLTTPQGERREVSATAALFRKIYEQAVKGNLKAAQYLLERFSKARERLTSTDAAQAGLSAAEEELLQAMFNGLRPDGEGAPA